MIPQTRKEISDIRIVLHNIRSTHNVGSIFRTADAIGVSKIYLSGYTPAPTDRFGRSRKDIGKAALGAEKTVAWETASDLIDLISKLKKEDFKIMALEQASNSVNYKKVTANEKTLLILGNEVDGIEKDILDKCDQIIEIPMKGEKESLNVSVAAGIALFQVFW